MITHAPSRLELQALSVLWQHGSATVREVREDMPDGRERAYTTVLTVLQNLQRKRLVRLVGGVRGMGGATRAHLYMAARSRSQILRPMLRELITNVFRGSPAGLIEHVLTEVGLTPAEKDVVSVCWRRLTSAVGQTGGTANEQNKNKDQVNTKMLAAKKAAKKAVKKAGKKKAKKKSARAAKPKSVKRATKRRAAKKAAKKAVKKAPKKKGKAKKR
jgi:predicted transcriptional regulator